MEDYQIVWTRSALADLDEITTYIARDSEVAADRMRAAILEHVDILVQFPLIGPIYPCDRQGTTREIVYRKYRIFYRIREAARQIEITTVWHSARQEPKHLG